MVTFTVNEYVLKIRLSILNEYVLKIRLSIQQIIFF